VKVDHPLPPKINKSATWHPWNIDNTYYTFEHSTGRFTHIYTAYGLIDAEYWIKKEDYESDYNIIIMASDEVVASFKTYQEALTYLILLS
jgi:hypothetical protein